MNNRASLARWVSALLVVLLFVCSVMPTDAFAATVNGAGAGVGGATSTASGSYAIFKTDEAVGYRVYIVDLTGAIVGDYPTRDVIRSGYASNYTSSTSASGRMRVQYTKFDIRNNYKNRVSEFANAVVTYDNGSAILNGTNTVTDTTAGVSFPTKIGDLPGWVTDDRINTMVNKLWTGLTYAQLQANGYSVVFELLVDIKIGGVWMTMTTTELAMLGVGQSKPGSPYWSYGGNYWYHDPTQDTVWDYCVPTEGYSNSWAFISRYTHAEWPYALRLSHDQFGFAGGSNLRYLGGTYRGDHGCASELIEDGYGMMIVYDYNGYYVDYYGNGATSGSTATSMHLIGTAKKLTANGFKRTGYTFAGWAKTASGSVAYSNQQSVTNLTTTPYTRVPLYAKWNPITYTVTYNGNGHTSGSTATSTHTYDAAKNLTANGYKKAYTVTYNANGGSCTTASAAASYSFGGWATSATGSKVYNDKQSVTNLTTTNGGNITLYAKWSGGTVTLPTPTRAGYTFKGWYTAASGGTNLDVAQWETADWSHIGLVLLPVLAAMVHTLPNLFASFVKAFFKNSELAKKLSGNEMNLFSVALMLMFVFACFHVPAAIGLYWLMQSIMSMLLQIHIRKRVANLPPEVSDLDALVAPYRATI